MTNDNGSQSSFPIVEMITKSNKFLSVLYKNKSKKNDRKIVTLNLTIQRKFKPQTREKNQQKDGNENNKKKLFHPIHTQKKKGNSQNKITN